MAGSRKSTPRRGRSSSVASNVSVGSAKPEMPSTPRRSKAAAAAASSSSSSSKKEKTAKVESAATPATPSATPSKALVARPALPKKTNPALPDADVPVKLQIIKRDGMSIIIGRVKLPTVAGTTDHAFLLKRFDTNAIAASSMFRLAFPYADAEAEKGEMAYLEKRFDADLANGGRYKALKKSGRGRPKKNAESDEKVGELPEGSSGVKLQGTWIPCSDAMEIAREYGLLRFAQPLIEAEATASESGQPILTPSKLDKVSSPTSAKSKRGRISTAGGSPTITRTRVTKRAKEDGTEEVLIEETKTLLDSVSTKGLTSSQIEAQIKEAQALAKGIQSGVQAKSTPSRKRRALNQAPTAELDLLADEDYEGSNPVLRSLRKGSRAARRRPVVTTAGALGAVGAGALAWISGGNFDVATQLVQQGVANLQSFFY